MSRAAAIVLLVVGLLLAAPLLAAALVSVPPSASRAAPASGLASSSMPGGPQPLAATVGLSVTTSTPNVNPKDTAVFELYFNNTGNQTSPDVWINVTTSGALTFLGDTAVGNASGYPRYHFASIGLGLHAFQMSFLVPIGTPPGSVRTVWATMVYADGSGSQHFVGPDLASVTVGVATKQLYLGWSVAPPGILTPVPPSGSLVPAGIFTLPQGGPAVDFDLNPVLARAFRALNVTVVLYVQPLAPMNLDLNLTLLDVNGATVNTVASVERVTPLTGSGYYTLVYAFPRMNSQFASGHRIRLQVLNMAGSGQSALLATNATAQPSRVAIQTTTYVSVDALSPPAAPPTYLSPKSALAIAANVSDPFGSGEIREVRLNLTAPSGPIETWLNLTASAVDPSNPSVWKLFRYTRPPLLANGTYSLEVTAVERNGVLDIAAGAFTVRAPSFTLEKVASVDQAKTGVRFMYSIWYNNTGTGPAGTVWINDTLPSQLNFQNSNPAASSSSGTTYRWVLTGVSVGSHVIRVNVSVRGGIGGVAYIRNWVSLNASDEHGFLWDPAVSHADVVLNGPVISLRVTSAPAAFLHANESVVFTVNLTNTGDGANTIWLNVTLPVGLTYVGDTAGALRGSRTIVGNEVRFVFTNMPASSGAPVTWLFTLTAQAGSGLVGGTALTSHIALNDTSSTNDLLMPEQVADAVLTVASPEITSARIAFAASTAVPVIRLPVYVDFTNAGNEPAGTVLINLSLDPQLRFVDASVPAVPVGDQVFLTATNAPVGPNRLVLNVSALASVVDRETLSVNGTIAATDGYGNRLGTVVPAAGSTVVSLPSVAFTLSPAALTVEAGGRFQSTISGGNSGSGTASFVWLNLSLPVGLEYASDTFGVRPSVLGSNYSWVWTAYVPGTHTYFVNLTATGAAVDRSTVDLTFSAQAADAGGNAMAASTFGGRVSFVGPAWLLSITPDRDTALASAICNYTVRVENVGSTPAHFLWLLLPLDPNVELITHTAPVPATGTATLNWTFQDIQPGQTIGFNVLVKVNPGTPAKTLLAETLEAHYTNSMGVVLGYVRSAPAQVQVQPDTTPLLYILVIGSVAGAGLVILVYRRYRVRIEDVFLVYRDGILISHLTNAEPRGKDEDVLSGMLTAVQDFVTDAFTYGEHRELHQLEFGDYHILIERGKSVYLAVVYQGRDSGLIRKKVRAVLDKIEARFGPVFERWDGDMGEVEGTQVLLREGFLDEEHPWSLVKPRA